MKEESLKLKEVFSEELFVEVLSSSNDLVIVRGGNEKPPVPKPSGFGCGMACGLGCGDNCDSSCVSGC